MNLTKKLLGASLALFMLSGCSTYIGGALFSATKLPQSVGTGSNGTKEGEACAMEILGMVAIGDASISAAKAQGGIKTVSHVDQANMNILYFLFANTCTRVTGE